jgi:hypothetical protein
MPTPPTGATTCLMERRFGHGCCPGLLAQRFPVPFPNERRECRDGNGPLRRHQAVPVRRARHASGGEQAREGRAERAGADAADPAERAARERPGRVGQGLLDAVAKREGHRRRRETIGAGTIVDDVEGERLALLAELDDEAVARGRGAMFDGQAQRVAPAAQIEIRVAPRAEFGGAAERLAGPGMGRSLARVVDEEHGGVEAALEIVQVREHRRDLGRSVLVDAMEPHERIEHQQGGPQECDRRLVLETRWAHVVETRGAPEAWPVMKAEFGKALGLERPMARASLVELTAAP